MWQLASESHRFLGGSRRHLSGSHPLLCCVTRVAARGSLCFLRSTVRWGLRGHASISFSRGHWGWEWGEQSRTGGCVTEANRQVDPGDAVGSGHWLCSTSGQDSAALSYSQPSVRDSSLPGSLGRFLLALLRVPELEGVTVPGWALPPSCRFLCPAQAVSASFCGDHDEYSGRVLEDPVRKKNHL